MAKSGSIDPDEDNAGSDDEERAFSEKIRASARARHRSPNYPFIGLEKGIERAKQIYDVERRNDVPVGVASEKRWELKRGSSQGDQTVAALRAFGLVEVNGTGDKRTLRISDRAFRILAGAQDKPERIKDAALAPPIHGELWQKYGTNGLPSNDVIRNYLLFERERGRFNEDVVDAFIAQFRETISFAKLISSDKVDLPIQDNGDQLLDPQEGKNMEIPAVPQGQQQKKDVLPPPPGQKDFPLYLSNNKRAILYVPASITAKDYDLLKRQIENHLAVIEATSVDHGDGN